MVSFFDDMGGMYSRITSSFFPEMLQAHLDDCLDTQTHPRIVELGRVAPRMTYTDDSRRTYRQDVGSGSLAPLDTTLAYSMGDPRERVY